MKMEIKHKKAFWFGIGWLFTGPFAAVGIIMILYGLGVFE